uniref:Uncharacterized protein n=1 Tax=Sarcophilus harrisii TaxID=9305 RepID=G3WHN0_SARHA
MVLILCCPRERISKSLYVMQLFILAGMVYYFFHARSENISEDNFGILAISKCVGETLRPVWGPADKCYPVTQNHRTENRKWRARPENKREQKAAKVYGMEPPADRVQGWVTQLLQGLWVDWFSAPNLPKTQNH